ncbi:unnamed protein product [Adineta ricciae]|uniref:Reverse transcriptase domain-containing protein n=1 Tax=Adineta ricciae TaxID=249248 RepID=A0A815THV6_ADIRI|nr:unnamed protein product [Adineta ricciae]
MSLDRSCFHPHVGTTAMRSTVTHSTASTCPQLQFRHEENKRKRRKCRGNRAYQRFRAKLRRQGFDNGVIETMISNHNTSDGESTNQLEPSIPIFNSEAFITSPEQRTQEHEYVDQASGTKRKRNRTSNEITASISQMSISYLPRKRHRSKTIESSLTEQEQMCEPLSNVKPKYLQVSDQIFKQMLSESSTDRTHIPLPILDTPQKTQFVRIYAHLLNNVLYLEMELNFWNHYQDVLTAEHIWSSVPLDKSETQKNSLYRSKFKTTSQLSAHQKLLENRLQRAKTDLNQHKQQAIHNYFDEKQLSIILTAFVRRGQFKLRADYERKKRLLQCDANDHRLIREFYDLKPTNNQIQSARIIWKLTKDKLQTEEDMNVLKQRIYTKRLPASFQILDHSIDNIEKMLQNPILNQDKRATLSSRRLKIIAQFKYDLMKLAILTAEETIRCHVTLITAEKKALIENVTSALDSPQPTLLAQVIQVVNKREVNMMQRQQIILEQKLSVFDDAPTMEDMTTTTVTIHNRLSSDLLDKIINQEFQYILQCFQTGFHRNCVSISDQRAQHFFAELETLVRQLYTTPIPTKLRRRAQYEQRTIRSIQRRLQASHSIVRLTDKSKVFHLGSQHEYHRKALEYMTKTNAYKELSNGNNLCADHLHKVLSIIDPLLKTKAINLKWWKSKMRPDSKTIELAHLYFIPKAHKVNTPLRPIVSSIKAAATGVSHFLDQILRPLYDQVAKSSTFINDIDFVRQLEHYRDSGRFRLTTTFVTFDVTDLYTMIPHNGFLIALGHFLERHSTNHRIHGMTIDTIMKLARLVLTTNCFAFNNKYYEQIRGGAMGSPLTMTLANIYMLEWEQPLIKYQKSQNELYGRYIDDVFMTTNSLSQMNTQLNEIEVKDPNIKIIRSAGTAMEFLDVYVRNENGQLKTCVYHKPAAEPYILPFLSEHPRHVHRNTIKGALFRAVRLCSDVEDFHHERLHVELTLLLNGYPLKFINYHFTQFFRQHQGLSLLPDQPMDQIVYEQLHRKILVRLSRREQKRNELITNYDTNEQKQINQSKYWNNKNITVQYTFQSGPLLTLKHKLNVLWKKHYVYEGSSMNHVRIQMGTRTNQSLSHLFVKKKPLKSTLADITSLPTTTSIATNTTNTNIIL